MLETALVVLEVIDNTTNANDILHAVLVQVASRHYELRRVGIYTILYEIYIYIYIHQERRRIKTRITSSSKSCG
jgi:hypothetical protein